tara:strand:+ start:937 stop:3588 length:2652 start_codon:yes stop_codon:yes gene_type:complete
MSKTQPAQPPPPTAAQKIITILESQSQSNLPNGQFDHVLNEVITLNSGDSLVVRNSFIDTSTAIGDNEIFVEPTETELTIEHGLYLTDSFGDPGIAQPQYNTSVQTLNRPDGQNYVLCDQNPATLNLQLTWTGLLNPAIPGNPTTFKVRWHPNVDPALYYQYVCVGNPVVPAALPTARDTTLAAENMVDMKAIMVQGENDIYFNIYHATYIPPLDLIPLENDHIATMTRWKDTISTPNIAGWEITRNPITNVQPVPVGQPQVQWTYAPYANLSGNNRFDDEGVQHLAVLDNIWLGLLPFWKPTTVEPFKALFPAFRFNYTDAYGNPQQISREFTDYPSPGVATEKGMADLVDTLGKANPQNGPYWPSQIAKGKTPDWQYYNFAQYIDPRNKGAVPLFQKIIFRTDTLPFLTPYYPANSGTTHYPAGDTGFMVPMTTVNDVCKLYTGQMGFSPLIHPASTGCVMTTRTYKTKITIPSKKYTYAGLAQEITDRVNEQKEKILGLSNNPDDSTQALNYSGFSSSRIFTSTYELSQQIKKIEDPDGNIEEWPIFPSPEVFAPPGHGAQDAGMQPFWVSESGTDIFQFNADEVHTEDGATGNPQWCGASAFSILYDDVAQAFKLDQAHSNIWSSGNPQNPGDIIIKQVDQSPLDDVSTTSFLKNKLTMSRAGGVFLTDLQPRSLWVDKMNFNTNMLVSPNNGTAQILTGTNLKNGNWGTLIPLESIRTHTSHLTTGIYTTGWFSGVNSAVRKYGAQSATNPLNQGYVSVPLSWDNAVATDTPITITGNPLIATGDDDPFYQIEIAGMSTNDIYGQPVKNNLIQSVVGKFFANGGFTSGSQADGFAYVHKGPGPLVITKLGIKIRDSTGNLQSTLGPHSAIILVVDTTK